MISWDWRADLVANTGFHTKSKAITSFFMVPAFNIVCWLRVMLLLQQRDSRVSRFFSRLISSCVIKKYGVHVSVLVKEIGAGLRLPHPTGIVIGEGASIGENVLILQNVTIGKKKISEPSIPTIGSGASILAGAVVLGSIHIGENAVVGANSVVLEDVPMNTTVVGIPARRVTVKDLSI